MSIKFIPVTPLFSIYNVIKIISIHKNSDGLTHRYFIYSFISKCYNIIL
jgi:hypothetical protein